MQSYWIWNYGDFEIYHYNQVLSRRQEYGVDYPCFRKCFDVDRNVQMFADIELEKDGYLKLYLKGIGYILIDGQRNGANRKIRVSKGKHSLKICVMNLTGLPSAYIESDVCASDGEWYTYDENRNKVKVGFDPKYNMIHSNPEEFIFEYEKIQPITEQKKNGGILFDFGKELFGYLYVNGVKAEERLHISYGESLDEALDTEYSILFEDVSGSDFYKLRQRAFRYIFITGTEEARVEADYEYLPLEYKGRFRCNDEEINKIWDVCAYTLHLNTREVFTDGVKRDRWGWAGDSYQAANINKYLFFDKEIVRRSIIALRGKEPFIEHINRITDFSFYWVLLLYEYYQAYGDIELVRFIYPRAVSLMEFSSKRINSDGFIIGVGADWIFVDWADIDRDGAVCAEQILYIAANRAMAELSDLIGKDGKKYRNIVDELDEKVDSFFWSEEKGAFIDCYESGKNKVTRHANILAVMYDIADAAQRERIIKNVIENDDITQITTPFFKTFELDVMGKIGRCEYIENMLKSYWQGMLELGATTFWEEYNPILSGTAHYGMYRNKYGKSLCHSWGASPIYLLGKYYLGVSQTSAGFETFEVKPCLGRFEYIEGTVPINGGEVYVNLSERGLRVTATKPGGTLVWNKKKYTLEPGKEIEIPNRT